jgi:hypothetical protein
MPKGHRKRLSSAEVAPGFGFGKGPPSVHADIAQQFRDDGYAVLDRRGQGLRDENLCWPAAHRVLEIIWSRLGELFLRSRLLHQWWPVCIVAKTQATLSINGCAGQITDPRSAYFFVGLHSGLFIHTADRLLRILSDPRAFPELGDARCEQAGRAGRLLEVMPRDPVLEAAALAMATMAVAAVFAHEVGHIVRGHIWLLRSRFGLTRLYETGMPAGGEPSGDAYVALRRAMELDADLFAGKAIGSFLFGRMPPAWCGALGKDRRSLLRSLALAWTCAFRTFEDQASDELYHTPFMRAQLMTIAARQEAASDVPFEFDDFKSSAWLPELLQILGPTTSQLDTALLGRDMEAMMQTFRATVGVQEELTAARDAMNQTLGRAGV